MPQHQASMERQMGIKFRQGSNCHVMSFLVLGRMRIACINFLVRTLYLQGSQTRLQAHQYYNESIFAGVLTGLSLEEVQELFRARTRTKRAASLHRLQP